MGFTLNSNGDNPCYNNGKPCDERTSTCHAKCETYIKWQEERKKKLDEVHEKKMRAFDANDFLRYHKKRTGRTCGNFKYQGGKR